MLSQLFLLFSKTVVENEKIKTRESGDTSMAPFDDKESELLAVMYEGDKSRDATSTIRGFIFQDYITIMCLLDPKVEYVCSEFLEDVDVFYEDGQFEFIQVKYYPNTHLKNTYQSFQEITTDLYYQFLRLKMLNSKLKPKPMLYIHGMNSVTKPGLDEMQTFIGLGTNLPKKKSWTNQKKPLDWLKTEVNKCRKKDDQKKKLFQEMASEETLRAFYQEYDIVNQPNIDQYKANLLQRLSTVFPNPETSGNKESWELMLLGLAVLYMQRRYTLNESELFFEKLRIQKSAFDDYIKQSLQTKTEETIVSYLVGIACEKYNSIVLNNEFSEWDQQMLYLISRKTIKWIKETANNLEGQQRLLNTISTEEANWLENFDKKSIEQRFGCIMESKNSFRLFLAYLWKIMLNICHEKMPSEENSSGKEALFDPATYILKEITDYICLKFPDDRLVNRSIILPSAYEDFSGARRKILERIIQLHTRPDKWFLANNNDNGRKYHPYDLNMADIDEGPTVANPTGDQYYIECMDCIKIEEGKWKDFEKCSDCIFTEKCVKEGK